MCIRDRDGSADVEPRLYPDLFLVRKEQLTEVPDGWIGIYTAEDLAAAKGESGNYILMSDVDMSQFGKWDPWKHLGGTFDGNGHTISNLIICLLYTSNTAFIRLLLSVGVDKVIEMAHAMGITSEDVYKRQRRHRDGGRGDLHRLQVLHGGVPL